VNDIMIFAIVSLSAIGVAAAIILYFVAQQFKVIEDPNIDLVEEATPGANCGGCGYAGCRNFAEEIVKAGNLDGFNCKRSITTVRPPVLLHITCRPEKVDVRMDVWGWEIVWNLVSLMPCIWMKKQACRW